MVSATQYVDSLKQLAKVAQAVKKRRTNALNLRRLKSAHAAAQESPQALDKAQRLWQSFVRDVGVATGQDPEIAKGVAAQALMAADPQFLMNVYSLAVGDRPVAPLPRRRFDAMVQALLHRAELDRLKGYGVNVWPALVGLEGWSNRQIKDTIDWHRARRAQ